MFTVTVPSGAVAGNMLRTEAAATVGGNPEYVEITRGQVAEWVTYPDVPPIFIPPSVNPLVSTGYCLCVDKNGDPEPGVTVSVQMVAGPGDDGFSYNTPVKRAVSDSNGVAVIEGNVRGSTIDVWRGRVSSNKVRFVVPDAGTFELPETL